jgi:hypothetical protein
MIRKREAAEGWLNLSEAARLIDVTNRMLRIEHGDIAAERPVNSGPWVINKQPLGSDTAKVLHQRAANYRSRPEVPSASQAVLDLSMTSLKRGIISRDCTFLRSVWSVVDLFGPKRKTE